MDLTLSDLVKIRSRSLFFFNENLYFLLHVLIAYLESFPKHYNKVTFHWVLSELWGLKVTVSPALSMYACACERDSYTRVSPRSIHTAWHTLMRTKLSPIFPNWIIQLSSFFRIAFSFNFFTLMGFFKAFFKMVAYSLNKIVDIILVLGAAGRNYCRTQRLYRNRYPFRRHPNAMQIRKILLRERRRIRKRNRK